jgi:RNA polymerase sigma factor (sigma-70 family)
MSTTNNHRTPAQRTGATPDYHGDNRRLGLERNALKAREKKISAIDPGDRTPLERREFAKTAREIDRVTWELVQLNYGLVKDYVRRFSQRSPRADVQVFEQAGVLGLMIAIDSFDPDKGLFGRWARLAIVNQVLKAVHETDHANLNLPDFEAQGKIRKVRDKWELEHGNEPIDHEWVAAETGLTIKQVGRVLNKHTLVSTSAPLGDEGGATLGDMIVDDDVDIADTVIGQLSNEALMKHALPLLDPQELYVLMRRSGLDAEPVQNLHQIGSDLGISREASRQAYLRAMAKICHPRNLKAYMQLMNG